MIYSYKNEKKDLEKKLNVSDIDYLISDFVKPISYHYVDFNSWLNKILIESKEFKKYYYRDILIVLDEKDKNIVGILILKKSDEENKLCTIFVKEDYRNKGLGHLLFFIADEILGSDISLSVKFENLKYIKSNLSIFNYKELYKKDDELFFHKGLIK